MGIAYSILLTLVLIIINGYFSMSEMALVNARRTVLQQEADEGDRRAQRALETGSDDGRFLATIQVAITLLGFFASAAASTALSDPLARWLSQFGIGWLGAIAPVLAIIIITLLVSYVTIVCGELLPKRIALSDPEGMAKMVAGPITGAQKVLAPLVSLVDSTTNGLARLLHVKGIEDRQAISEDEIKYLVTEQDSLLDEEKRMIHEIFDLGDEVAREIMVPRVDMMLLEDTETVRSATRRMQGTGFSRIPVYHEDYDRIIGVLMMKDLIDPLMGGKEEESITVYMRGPVFVPDTKDILPLLSEMQTSHQQMVIVVDEYGGTAGLITIEDIVEEIVGDIADEFDPDNKYLTRLSSDEWLADGRLPIDEAIEEGWPVEDSDGYETVAGWLLDTIDYVPSPGDVFEIDDYRFRVQSMRRRRIALLRVTKLTVSPEKRGDLSEEEGVDD